MGIGKNCRCLLSSWVMSSGIFFTDGLVLSFEVWAAERLGLPFPQHNDPAMNCGSWKRHSFLYSLHVLKLGVHPKSCIFIGFSHHRYCKPSIHRSPRIDKNSHIHCWLVVWHIVYFSIYWEFHHPNWRTPSFFRGVGQPPTRLDLHRKVDWSRSGLRLLNLRPSSSARLVNISPSRSGFFWVHGTYIYINCKHVFV